MGHYYECKDCGYERCRCGPPSLYDDFAFTTVKETWLLALDTETTMISDTEMQSCIKREWMLEARAHTHHSRARQMNILVDGQSCPVEVIVTILNKLANNEFSAGIARVEGPLYRQMREPRAAAKVVIAVCERLGLTLGEYTPGRRLSKELGTLTFVGHRDGPWKLKAKALLVELSKLLQLEKNSRRGPA